MTFKVAIGHNELNNLTDVVVQPASPGGIRPARVQVGSDAFSFDDGGDVCEWEYSGTLDREDYAALIAQLGLTHSRSAAVTIQTRDAGGNWVIRNAIVTRPQPTYKTFYDRTVFAFRMVEAITYAADFTADVTSGDGPLTVQFTDASVGEITAYSWDFGDGVTSSDPSPTHTFKLHGTNTVTLTVTGPGGTDTRTLDITVSIPAGWEWLYVDQAHPSASDSNDGLTPDAPLLTFGAALDLMNANKTAGTPTRIILRDGVYEEEKAVTNTQGNTTEVVIDAFTPSGAVISGSEVWDSGWTQNGGLWEHAWPYDWGLSTDLWAQNGGPAMNDILRRREMVFLDGTLLRQYLTLTDLNAADSGFHVDETGDLLSVKPPAGVNFATAEVRVAVRTTGVKFTHFENLSVQGLAVQHFTGETNADGLAFYTCHNVTLRDLDVGWCNSQGIRWRGRSDVDATGSPGSHNVLHIFNCRAHDCGFCGWKVAYVLDSDQSEGIHMGGSGWRNEWGNQQTWDVGDKFLSMHRVDWRNITSTDSKGWGIWFDWDNRDSTIRNLRCTGAALGGIFVEASTDLTFIDPVFKDNSTPDNGFHQGGAIFMNESQNITFQASTPGAAVLACNNEYQVCLQLAGSPRTVVDFETGVAAQFVGNNMTFDGLLIYGEASGEKLFLVPNPASDAQINTWDILNCDLRHTTLTDVFHYRQLGLVAWSPFSLELNDASGTAFSQLADASVCS